MKRIFLDSAAGYANPSSLHQEGVKAAADLALARRRVAAVLGATSDEIIFTSGGTESNNLAIFGVIPEGRPVHIITGVIEHHSVLGPCLELERRGATVTYLPVDKDGLVSPKNVAAALRPSTVLVSIMYANNEIGAIQPIREIAKILRRAAVRPLFHTDACQAANFLDLNVARLGVDLLTLNGAKIGGPVSVGALYVKRGVKLRPLLFGGGQENSRRAGTENVAGIVAFSRALLAAQAARERESARLTKLRDFFINQLLKLPGTSLNGPVGELRLPNNINVSFADCEGEQLVLELDAAGVAVSAGSACAQPTGDASYVIMALGKSEAEAKSAVRFTLSRTSTKSDLNYVLKILPPILKRLRTKI